LTPGAGEVICSVHRGLTRDIHLFSSVARIEAALATRRQALQRLPEIAAIDKTLARSMLTRRRRTTILRT
jgi:hypothetical protein